MDPIRPTPLRPYNSKREAELRGDKDSIGSLKHSKSSADVSSLSRTSSFLSFAGLENLKSSALFGIFEQGGLDNDIPTPDLQKHYDFHLSDPPTPPNPQANLARLGMLVSKLFGVAAASLAFIELFNRIPNKNKFCTISSAHPVHPVVYAILATATAFALPILDSRLKAILPTKNKVSSPIEQDAAAENASLPDESQRRTSNRGQLSYNVLIRYFAGLLGLAYAGTKLEFSQSSQFNLCVCAISFAILLILDRSTRGLILSLAITSIISTGYIYITSTPPQDIAGVTSLVWLNVCVYGTLGKLLKIWP